MHMKKLNNNFNKNNKTQHNKNNKKYTKTQIYKNTKNIQIK